MTWEMFLAAILTGGVGYLLGNNYILYGLAVVFFLFGLFYTKKNR